MQPKFTPGPWIACPGQTNLVMREKDWNDSQTHIGVMADSMQIFTSLKNGEGRAVADAHLVAASPEMYEALAKLVSAPQYELDNCLAYASEVLAKASGELSKDKGEG